MIRKTFIALIALAAVAAFTATEASARGHGGRGGMGHASFSRGSGIGHSWGGRSWGGGRSFAFHRGYSHRRFYGTGLAFYGGYNSCYRWRPVPTRYGIQMRRVWVCGYRYY